MTARAEVGLDLLLRRADLLVASAATAAVALEDYAIELPPPGVAVDQAQLRALATLYLASELEGAGAIPAAEALVRLARGGSLSRDFGDATGLMQTLWQSRQERIGSAERLAIFSRLFGTATGTDDAHAPSQSTFEERLIDLCEALYRLDEAGAGGGISAQTRVRSAARRLLSGLVQASSGFTALVAQEVLSALKLSLAILAHPDVKAAFGARGVWDVVVAIDRVLRQPTRPHALHLQRGQAGMTLLAWLADTAPRLDAPGGALVTIGDPVIEAAVDWLEASLALSETPASREPLPAGPPGSDWGSFGE